MSEMNAGVDPVGRRRVAAGIGEGVGSLDSAVSWSAILAGAAGAAALSMLLLILGTGFGLSVVSPWTMEGIGAATFGFATIAWLSFTQMAASGMGGYLAGRLRTKWASVHADEVFFRDTAHGFLSWAVASLLTAAVLTSVAGAIVGGGLQAGSKVAGEAAGAVGSAAGDMNSDEAGDSIGYFVESLFRGDRRSQGSATTGSQTAQGQPGASPSEQQSRDPTGGASEMPIGEVSRIFTRALRTGTLPEQDIRYVGQLIAQRTDLSEQEAEQRVAEGFDNVQAMLDDLETTAREVADEAREAAAYGALWVFVALLIGAFIASLMAVFGGRQRDA